MFSKRIIYVISWVIIFLPINIVCTADQSQPEVVSLDYCLYLAFQNNKQLQASEKNVVIAEDEVNRAKADYWPTVDYQMIQENSDEDQYFVGINDYKYDGNGYHDNRLSAGLKASVSLYDGGLRKNNLKLAEIRLDMAKEEARKAKQQLTYDVKQAFYSVWLAEQMLQVQQASYDNLKQHAARVQMLYDAGTVSKYDLLQAEVQRDTLKPEVITAKNQLVLAKLQLTTLTGFPRERSYTVDFDLDRIPMSESVGITLSHVLEEAYQNRPEIHQTKQTEELTKIQTAMAESGYKPNIALSVGYNGVNKNVAVDDWYREWSLTFSLTGKIYDRAIRTQVDQYEHQQDLTVINEADLHDQIRLEAEKSLQNLEVNIEKTRANQSNIKLAKESLYLAQVRFEAGVATTMDILDAQLALDKNLNGYYQGIVSYLTAEAQLDLLIGKD